VFLKDAFAIGDVFVFEDFDGGFGEACAVDDGGMVEFIGDDQIFFAEYGGDGAGVGGEAGLENHTGFDIFKSADLFFEGHVDLHSASDSAHGSGAYAEALYSVDGSFPQALIGGQAQVIVGGEIDDLATVEGADGALFAFEDAEFGG
jgi:hypothetical protein